MQEIIDLTLEIYEGIEGPPQVVPTTMFQRIQFMTHRFSAPNYEPPMQGFAESILIMAEHTGTHVDIPFHTDAKGITLEKVALDKFIGDAVLIDVSEMKKVSEPITYDLLEQATSDQELEVRQGDIVLVRAWPGKWGEGGFYACEGFTMDSVTWFKERKVKTLGTDLAMIDYSGDLRCQLIQFCFRRAFL